LDSNTEGFKSLGIDIPLYASLTAAKAADIQWHKMQGRICAIWRQ